MSRTKKLDGRNLKRTGRTRQLNLKVRDDFYQLIYRLAEEEGCLITELVEKAVLEYQQKPSPKKVKNQPNKSI
jgi:hypothetical protein